MSDIRLNVNRSNAPVGATQSGFTTYDLFNYPLGGAFISNYANLVINGFSMMDSVAYSIIYNEGDLTLSGLQCHCFEDDSFDVNDLRSHTMINQRGSSSSSVVISDSTFIGSKYAVFVRFALHTDMFTHVLVKFFCNFFEMSFSSSLLTQRWDLQFVEFDIPVQYGPI